MSGALETLEQLADEARAAILRGGVVVVGAVIDGALTVQTGLVPLPGCRALIAHNLVREHPAVAERDAARRCARILAWLCLALGVLASVLAGAMAWKGGVA